MVRENQLAGSKKKEGSGTAAPRPAATRGERPDFAGPGPDGIAHLQRTIGNRAVGALWAQRNGAGRREPTAATVARVRQESLEAIVQLARGVLAAPDKTRVMPGDLQEGDEVEIVGSQGLFYRVKKVGEDKPRWIERALVRVTGEEEGIVKEGESGEAPPDRTIGEDPAQANSLIYRLKEAAQFVRTEAKGEVAALLNKARDEPKTMDELENLAVLGNQVYEKFDHKLKEDVPEYESRLTEWVRETHLLVYRLRDQLLMKDPTQLARFSLAGQYRQRFPGNPMPPELVEVDKTLGAVIFSTDVGNDCGRFASALLAQRVRTLVGQFLSMGTAAPGKVTAGERAQLLKQAAASPARQAKLIYKEDTEFPYPHHAKTAVAETGGKIYTLEAHKGRPLLLAPELQVYETEGAFQEEKDEYIAERTATSLKEELERQLAAPDTRLTDEERYAELAKLVEVDERIVKPLGKSPADFAEKVPALPSAPSSGSREEVSEDIADFKFAIGRIDGVPQDKMAEMLAHLSTLKKLMDKEFDEFAAVEAWCTGDPLNLKFDADKYATALEAPEDVKMALDRVEKVPGGLKEELLVHLLKARLENGEFAEYDVIEQWVTGNALNQVFDGEKYKAWLANQ